MGKEMIIQLDSLPTGDEARKMNVRKLIKTIHGADRFLLTVLKLELQEILDSTKSQVDFARSKAFVSGEYSDWKWFHAAKHVSHAAGRCMQVINAELSRAKAEQSGRSSRTFERAFVDAARYLLDKETYLKVSDKAKELGEFEQEESIPA